jgi:hypothetical protein
VPHSICRAGTSIFYTGHCLRASYVSYGHNAGVSFADLAHKTGHRSEAGMAAYRRIMPDKEKEVQDTVLSSMLSKRPSDSSENSLSAPQPPPKVPRISTTRASRLGQELPQLQSCAPVDAHSNNTVSSLQIVPVSDVSTALQASACLDPTSLHLQESIPTAPLPLLRGTELPAPSSLCQLQQGPQSWAPHIPCYNGPEPAGQNPACSNAPGLTSCWPTYGCPDSACPPFPATRPEIWHGSSVPAQLGPHTGHVVPHIVAATSSDATTFVPPTADVFMSQRLHLAGQFFGTLNNILGCPPSFHQGP